MTNKQAFATTLAMLGATYDKKLAAPAIEGYWLVLSDLTEAEFAAATKRALAANKFMPTPSELLAFAGHAPSDHAADAVEAWSVVRACVDSVDYTGSVDFGPLVNAVIWNLGGWQRLCDLGLSELNVWAKKDFERVYVELAQKNHAALRCEPFIGFLHRPPQRIAIGGKMPPLALPAAPNPVSDVVRQLADAKSQAGAAPPVSSGQSGASADVAVTFPASPGDRSLSAPPLRETKPPTRITEDEKQAAIEKMRAALVSRGVTVEEAKAAV